MVFFLETLTFCLCYQDFENSSLLDGSGIEDIYGFDEGPLPGLQGMNKCQQLEFLKVRNKKKHINLFSLQEKLQMEKLISFSVKNVCFESAITIKKNDELNFEEFNKKGARSRRNCGVSRPQRRFPTSVQSHALFQQSHALL